MALPDLKRLRPVASKAKKIHPITGPRPQITKTPTKNPIANPKRVAPPINSGSATAGAAIRQAAPAINPAVKTAAPVKKVAPPPVLTESQRIIADRQKSADLLHQQNIKDQADFQKWYSGQADTAEAFLNNRYAQTAQNTQASVNAALEAAKSLSQRVGQDVVQGAPEQQLTQSLQNLHLNDMVSDQGYSGAVQNAGAVLTANNRFVDNARMKDFGQRELQMHTGRMAELDKMKLDDAYKQQQFRIDQSTAEALGAKNAADAEIDRYRAETDRKVAMSDAEYKRQQLLIEKAYKAGSLSMDERKLELELLAADNKDVAERSGNAAKMQSGARKIAQERRKAWEAVSGKVFNNKNSNPAQRKSLFISAANSIRNDWPGISDAQIRQAIAAEFGEGAVSVLVQARAIK